MTQHRCPYSGGGGGGGCLRKLSQHGKDLTFVTVVVYFVAFMNLQKKKKCNPFRINRNKIEKVKKLNYWFWFDGIVIVQYSKLFPALYKLTRFPFIFPVCPDREPGENWQPFR